jgi:outer membrane protein assembly factor BamB
METGMKTPATHRVHTVALAALSAFAVAAPTFGDVVGWRMDGDGRYPETTPPLSWSKNDGVVWKTRLPSWSNASPVLLEDRSLILVLSEPDEIIAVNANDGSVAWKDSVGDVTAKRPGAHKSNGWTTPTPVSDGANVYTSYGSGVVAAHGVDGKRLWARMVQQPSHRWGHSASPVLGGGNLIVHFVDLIALDPKTGEEVWRTTSEVRWGTPLVTRVAGTEVVITPSGDVFRADDGTPVASGIGSLQYAAPVVQDGVVYFIEKRATAVRLPDTLDGKFETLWMSRVKGSRHYASPVIHEGLIYAVSREQKFSILDATTGEVLHQSDLDLDSGTNSAYPSISMAGDKIFLSTENGATAVLEPGREYAEVARSSLEGFRSSPVFAGERMYVRAFDHLYCIASSD